MKLRQAFCDFMFLLLFTFYLFYFFTCCSEINLGARMPFTTPHHRPTKQTQKGHEKLNFLLSKSKERPLIELNSNQFNDLVGRGPRPYSLVVILTQVGGKCGMCELSSLCNNCLRVCFVWLVSSHLTAPSWQQLN